MKATILLNKNDNTKQVEDEEKMRFVRDLLEQMGVSIQDIWESDSPLTINQKIKLRSLLATYNIQIVDDLDGRLQMFVDGEKIANFEKPTYKLKRDLSQLDPKKQLFLEMSIDCWSLFEEQNE